jgi:hypothetical protein
MAFYSTNNKASKSALIRIIRVILVLLQIFVDECWKVTVLDKDAAIHNGSSKRVDRS